MSDPVVYVVAPGGDERASAYLGTCGRDGVLQTMWQWDKDRYALVDPRVTYEWTDDHLSDVAFDVYEIDGPLFEDDALFERLKDLEARLIGHIQPVFRD